MRHVRIYIAIICCTYFLSGCGVFRGLKNEQIVKHPDSPMLIEEIKSNHARVAIYDKVNNQMIEFGWVKIDDRLEGWTITKYDWEKFLKSKESE